MKTETRTTGGLSLRPCHYGLSRVPFRGPQRPTDGRYVAFLGGSETFARFVRNPYPDLIETAIGEVCVNLGCQAAGPDVFLTDAAIETLCHDAALTVIQVPGAANLSNRFYKVHPRRNDRFIAPTDALMDLYPEVDFTDIAFVGHLITRLRNVDEDRFLVVRDTLEKTWRVRMQAMISRAGGQVLLLWLASRAPEEAGGRDAHPANDPMFVSREMLEGLREEVLDIVEVVSPHGDEDESAISAMDHLAAREMLGPLAHQKAAKALRTPIQHGLT